MGEELKRILEGQSELEQQFNKLTQDGPGPSGQQLKDQAHAVSVSSQGELLLSTSSHIDWVHK